MNISYRWLQAIAPGIQEDPETLKERLASVGAPVDAMVRLGAGLEDVLVARVVEARRHPNADRLSLCQVDAGTGELVSVVCGAPNVRSGGLYPFAPAGSTLPDGKEIRRAKIRGEESRGMLCSERELGIGRDSAGIMELTGNFEPGVHFVTALGLDDVRFELDIGANRPDLLSHIGVAREVAPGGNAGLRLDSFPGAPPFDLTFSRAPEEGRVADVRVRIDNPAGCSRFLGAVIRGVTIAPSPAWLAARLRAVGSRPINNVVDATNYVLHELGQPMHAYDLQRLGDAVIVRDALAGETLTTLDGETRKLGPGMLMIADATRPVGVAGVMGGRDTEVSQETRDVFLEAALFDPATVRRTRRALNLSTDASYRFERGVDFEGMERALRRAVELIVSHAGGTVEQHAVDVCPRPPVAPGIRLRTARVSGLLGSPLSGEKIREYLEPIGFAPVEQDADSTVFRIPGARWYDVQREVDLIEEVARRHGYDNFPDELRAFRPTSVPDDPFAQLESHLRAFLTGRGFLEARSSSFTGAASGEVALLDPLSAAETHLRKALVPGLVQRVEYNFSHGTRHIRLFEIGTAFGLIQPRALPRESTRLALVLTGARTPPHWSGQSGSFDVWDLKGISEDLARMLGHFTVQPGGDIVSAGLVTALDDGTAFTFVSDTADVIGAAGRVARAAVDAPPWSDPVWVLELTLTPAMTERGPRQMRALPAHPGTDRDMALLLTEDLSASQVEDVIRAAGGAFLESVSIFDVYRGKSIPANMRSVAYRVVFRAPERTLTDDEADLALNGILRRLKEELGVERRG